VGLAQASPRTMAGDAAAAAAVAPAGASKAAAGLRAVPAEVRQIVLERCGAEASPLGKDERRRFLRLGTNEAMRALERGQVTPGAGTQIPTKYTRLILNPYPNANANAHASPNPTPNPSTNPNPNPNSPPSQVNLLILCKDARPPRALGALMVLAARRRVPTILIARGRRELGGEFRLPATSALAFVEAEGKEPETPAELKARQRVASLVAFLRQYAELPPGPPRRNKKKKKDKHGATGGAGAAAPAGGAGQGGAGDEPPHGFQPNPPKRPRMAS